MINTMMTYFYFIPGSSTKTYGIEDEHVEGSGFAVRTKVKGLPSNKEADKIQANKKEESTSNHKEGSSILTNDVIASKPVKPKKGAGCVDKFKNCNIVVQSRLCKYAFYQTNCCRSCTLMLP